MIVSASRRTDIPAFYSQWFFNRLKQQSVMVRNPMNPKMISKIPLTPDLIDAFVFWTKNPRPMMNQLHQLDPIPFYFLFTITAHGTEIEKYLPPKNTVINTFKELSQHIGKNRTIWRYDPIMLTDRLTADDHALQFETIAQKLENHTDRCIISFLDMYQKCKKNLAHIKVNIPTQEEKIELTARLTHLGKKYGIDLFSCAENPDFSALGVRTAACINAQWLQHAGTGPMTVKEDPYQRPDCHCIESVDIGAYNSCKHLCLYCYANANENTVKKNTTLHCPQSPMLLGKVRPGDRVVDRKGLRRLSEGQGDDPPGPTLSTARY